MSAALPRTGQADLDWGPTTSTDGAAPPFAPQHGTIDATATARLHSYRVLIRYGHIIPLIAVVACLITSASVTIAREVQFAKTHGNDSKPNVTTTTTEAPATTTTTTTTAPTLTTTSASNSAAPFGTTTTTGLPATSQSATTTTTAAPSPHPTSLPTTSAPTTTTTSAPTTTTTSAPTTTITTSAPITTTSAPTTTTSAPATPAPSAVSTNTPSSTPTVAEPNGAALVTADRVNVVRSQGSYVDMLSNIVVTPATLPRFGVDSFPLPAPQDAV